LMVFLHVLWYYLLYAFFMQEVAYNIQVSLEFRRVIIRSLPLKYPVGIPCEKNTIRFWPPLLTRFEKARIMGARALQLSLGAPPFIPIPKSARISLDISMEELEQRVIPITIRRVLPNGDYQNIPIDYFEK